VSEPNDRWGRAGNRPGSPIRRDFHESFRATRGSLFLRSAGLAERSQQTFPLVVGPQTNRRAWNPVLRVGTDIVGGDTLPTFNATFSLAGVELPPCSGPASGGTWRNLGQYVSTVARLVGSFLEQGVITQEQADAIVASAAESSCGKKQEHSRRS
jgi:hypothetical protein